MFSGKGLIPTCLFHWECLGAERCVEFLAAEHRAAQSTVRRAELVLKVFEVPVLAPASPSYCWQLFVLAQGLTPGLWFSSTGRDRQTLHCSLLQE